MKSVLVLSGVLALGIALDAYSQSGDAMESYRLQIRSPQLSDMILYDRFGNTDESSGRLDLAIDLIHWEDPDFDLPIRLKYNSEGFKPNNVENYVGRNWSLTCGGIIYREINGIADDQRIDLGPNIDETLSQYGFLQIKSQPMNQKQTEKQLYEHPAMTITGLPETRLPVFESDWRQEVSSDIYHFSFGKYSGKFMINFDGTVSVVSFSGGKFEVDISDYGIQMMTDLNEDYKSEIRIKTDDGYTYCFGGSYDAVEYMSLAWSDQDHESAVQIGLSRKYVQSNKVVAWGLRKIIAPNDRTLTIRYMHLPPKYCNRPTELLQNPDECVSYGYNRNFSVQCTPYYHTDYSMALLVANGYWFEPTGSFSPTPAGCIYALNKLMLVEQIDTDDKQLMFSYSDLEESPYEYTGNPVKFSFKCGATLDAVTLTNNGREIERSELAYAYVSKRLFLSRVSNSKTGSYGFYYDTAQNSLPRINTHDIDHWGYYRSIPNTALVPPLENATYLSSYHKVSYQGTDRAPLLNDRVSLGMLTRVGFPTGGSLQIGYEPHTYSARLVQEADTDFYPVVEELRENRLAGGLRVKSLTYTSDRENTNQVFYVYNKSPESNLSSGMLMYQPRYYHQNRTFSQRAQKTLSFPVVDAGGFNRREYASEYIRYSTVSKLNVNSYSVKPDSTFVVSVAPLDTLDRDGYVVSKYSDYRTNPDLYTNEHTFRTVPLFKDLNYTMKLERDTLFFRNYFLKPESRAVERGKLLSRTVFDRAGNPLQRTTYRYATPGFDRYSVYVATPPTVNNVFLDMYSHLNKERMYACLPAEVTTTLYAGTDSLTKVEYTDYDPYGYPLSTRSVNPDSTEHIVTTKRILHVADQILVYQMMKNENMVGAIHMQEETFRRGGRLSYPKCTIFEYGRFDRLLPPACSQIIESHGMGPRERMRYLAYDSYGNPLHTVENETLHTVYIWSYLGKYPIARIEHATYDEVSAALSVPIDEWSCHEVPDMAEIERLRFELPRARIWTYTYRPSVGMMSETDPSGQMTRYGYDSAGRLTYAWIDGPGGERQLIEYNEYHIVNQ